MYITMIIVAGLIGAIGQFIDKHLSDIGSSDKDYFYYMCVTMIPFSLVMTIIEYLTGHFRFQMNVYVMILLVCAMILRYLKQNTTVNCLKYLNTFEDSSYLALGIIIAFIIDVILGIEKMKVLSIISIILTIFGVFIISNSKIRLKNVNGIICLRVLTTLFLSYVTHYILIYLSNAVFILILNVLLTIIFSGDYTFKYHREHKKVFDWCFIQQIFGFSELYLVNFISERSVTLSSYERPASILFILVISMFLKDSRRRPTLKQTIGVLCVIIGILLIN